MSASVPQMVMTGDPRHGVALFAGQLAAEIRRQHPLGTTDPRAVHVHFTDRLWGRTPERAAARVAALATGRRLTVTLHDVPQPSDGPEGMERRRAAYRRVAQASAGIVVASEHERSLLQETGTLDATGGIEVIPLPVIEAPASPAPVTAPCDEIALIGWIYPGKGHAEAIDAVARLDGDRPPVRALGAVAPGHDAELSALRARARRLGVDFAATGWLDPGELLRRARAARVPLAAHAHVSASGSINSWIAAGRVPLVLDSRYARELARLRPGCVRLYPAGGLTDAIVTARDDPGLHRLACGAVSRPHLGDCAAHYRRWWASL